MAYGKKELLKAHLETIHGAIRRVLDDITEEESVRTLLDNPNHIKWQAGHLIFTSVLSARTLGGEFLAPDGWAELFRRGAPAPGPDTKLPAMTDVRTVLYSGMEKVESLIDQASDEWLATKRVIAPKWEDTPAEAVLFLAAHDFYHTGQIVMIRRAIGRERCFG